MADVHSPPPAHVKPETERITLMRESQHTLIEDVFAIVIGVMLVSFGVYLFQQSNLILGGVAGMSLVASYASGWDFGLLFFLINLPFYLFGIRGMELVFIAKTFAAVALMSVLVRMMPEVLDIEIAHPAISALFGGVMIGLGLLALFRHGAGLGGINILVFWLQSQKGWRAGYVQLAIDILILCAGIFFIGWQMVAWSVIGAVMFNLILGLNHRPGRYMGVS